jgi:hypothetical protein
MREPIEELLGVQLFRNIPRLLQKMKYYYRIHVSSTVLQPEPVLSYKITSYILVNNIFKFLPF